MPLAVCASEPRLALDANRLAGQLGLPLLAPGTLARDCEQAEALLVVDSNVLSLRLCGRKAPGAVAVDFGAPAMRFRRGSGHNELLGKAVGVGKKQGLAVLDATGGLGRDSFVLADLGARVTLCERHPVIAAMLESGLERAAASADDWLGAVAARMRLFAGDAREAPAGWIAAADVIYLDPMFPGRDKRAAVKKEMALFQFLLREAAADDDELLRWALASEVSRVVIKRPLRAAPLAGKQPSHSIRGKAVRYDVHVLAKIA